MTETVTLLKPTDAIPVGDWRMGIFVLNERVMGKFSEDYLVEYIAYWSSQTGLDVAKNTMRLLAVELHIGADPGITFGGWVRNTVAGLTPSKYTSITKIPAMFSTDTATGTIELYLNTLQGKLAAGVIRAQPRQWATPYSWLQTDVWYPVGAVWPKGSPSVKQLADRLESIGCDLYYVDGKGVEAYRPPYGMLFMFHSGTVPKTLGQVQTAIKASHMVLDLNSAKDDASIGYVDDLGELGDETLETIGEAAKSLSEAAKGVAGGAGAAFDILGALLKYGPPLAIGGLVAYGGYRVYQRASRGRGR